MQTMRWSILMGGVMLEVEVRHEDMGLMTDYEFCLAL
jgi:hypothetical protein